MFGRREWRSRPGEEGKDPVMRPVAGAKALPAPAGAGQKAHPSPTGGGPAAGPGRRRTGKGQPGVADAASVVLGSRGEGVGVAPAPAVGSDAPVAPAGGRAGKGEQTPVPAEAPAPPLQSLPPHSPARAFLFR